MTPVEIAVGIVSVLMLVSRFVQAAKPAWERLPKPVAVLLPPIVALIPQVVDLLNQTKNWSDLVNYIIAAVAMVVVGLFPKAADAKSTRHDPVREDPTRREPVDPVRDDPTRNEPRDPRYDPRSRP